MWIKNLCGFRNKHIVQPVRPELCAGNLCTGTEGKRLELQR